MVARKRRKNRGPKREKALPLSWKSLLDYINLERHQAITKLGMVLVYSSSFSRFFAKRKKTGIFLSFFFIFTLFIEKREKEKKTSLPLLSLFSFRKIKRRDEEDEIYIFLVSSFFLLLFLPFSSFLSESENLIVSVWYVRKPHL